MIQCPARASTDQPRRWTASMLSVSSPSCMVERVTRGRGRVATQLGPFVSAGRHGQPSSRAGGSGSVRSELFKPRICVPHHSSSLVSRSLQSTERDNRRHVPNRVEAPTGHRVVGLEHLSRPRAVGERRSRASAARERYIAMTALFDAVKQHPSRQLVSEPDFLDDHTIS